MRFLGRFPAKTTTFIKKTTNTPNLVAYHCCILKMTKGRLGYDDGKSIVLNHFIQSGIISVQNHPKKGNTLIRESDQK